VGFLRLRNTEMIHESVRWGKHATLR